MVTNLQKRAARSLVNLSNWAYRVHAPRWLAEKSFKWGYVLRVMAEPTDEKRREFMRNGGQPWDK